MRRCLMWATFTLLTFGQYEYLFAQPGSLTSISVSLGDNAAGVGTIYTINFTTSALGNGIDTGIPINGRIRLTFPSGFSANSGTIAASINGSIDGGFTTNLVGGNPRIIDIIRDGTGTAVAASQAVSISVANVANSTTSGSTYTITIATKNGAGTDVDTGTTPTFSITVGSLTSIKIRNQTGGGGSEVGTLSLTTDVDNTILYAAGYDAYGNFHSNVSVAWTVNGGIGSVSPVSGTSTTLTLNKTGLGNVEANDGNGHSDGTGTITVTAGALASVKVVEGTSGDGTAYGNHSMTTDGTITLHAAGYDADNNYQGDASVIWSITGNSIGSVSPSSGTSTVFDATAAGTGRVRATHASVGNDETGDIVVSVGALNYIRINDVSGSGGSEIGDVTRNADQTLTLYASSYDADDNYRGAISVNWAVTGGIGDLTSSAGNFTTFQANTVGTGTITANDGSGHTDATGAITVTTGALSEILIVEGASGNGAEFGTRTITTDQTITFHAAGYDADGNYRSDEPATWSVTGSAIGTVSPSGGVSTVFSATTLGTGQVRATHASVGVDNTGNITVTAGAVSYIRIVGGISGDGAEYTTNTIQSGQSFQVHAVGYDSDDNYAGNQTVNWSVVGGIGNVSPSSNSVATTFTGVTIGTGYIKATHSTAGYDYTDDITVQPGALHHIRIRNEPNGGGIEIGNVTLFKNQSLVMYAAGYDANNNYIAEQTAVWDTTKLLSGTKSTLDRPADRNGEALVFIPLTAGTNGRFIADAGSGMTDVTGTVTISNNVSYVKINNAPGSSGEEVGNLTLAADDSVTLYAAAYDQNGSYLDTVSVTWSGTTLDGPISKTGASLTFAPITAPDAVQITADHTTATDDVTGTISVVPGKPASQFKLIPTVTELSANGTDNTAVTSDVITDSDGNTIVAGKMFTVSVTPKNMGITFTPADASASIPGHQVVSNASGKIPFTFHAGTKGGTAFLSARSAEGGTAQGDTVLTLSAIRIISVTSIRSKVSKGQDQVQVNMLVENIGPQQVQTPAATLKFLGPGNVKRSQYYSATLDNPIGNLDVGQHLISFHVDVALTAPAELLSIDGTISGLADGAIAVQDTAADQRAQWTVQRPPQLSILSITAPKDTVERGNTASVYMTVQNTGDAHAVINADSIRFFMNETPFTNITRQYSQTGHPANPDTIFAAAPAVQLTYSVTVGANAAEGSVKLDGRMIVRDANSDSLVQDSTSSATDVWYVKKKGELSVVDFYPSQQYITFGQTTPWRVTMRVQNNFDTTSVTLDSARLAFFAGTADITPEYSVIYPTKFVESDNDTLFADSTETLIFDIDTTGITTGYIRIVGTAYLSDVAHTQLIASGEDQVIVQSPSDLLITQVIPTQSQVTVGQTKDWKVKAVVRNAGSSSIVLDFASDSTRVRFAPHNDFAVIAPTRLKLSGDSLLVSNAIDTVIFTIDSTGLNAGEHTVDVKLAYADINAMADTKYQSDNEHKIKVETPPNIRIASVTNIAPNAPYVNTNQQFPIRVIVENTGQDGVHGVQMSSGADGKSLIAPIAPFSIAGNSQDSVLFQITADTAWTPEEWFVFSIDTAIGDNTSEFDSTSISKAVDSTSASLQRPATAIIEDIIIPDTVLAQSNNWTVQIAIKRDGTGAVQFENLLAGSLTFTVNSELQTDYLISAPTKFKNRSGLKLEGWDDISDTLVYTIVNGGLRGGQASVSVTLPVTYLNNDSSAVLHSSKGFIIQTPDELRLTKTDPLCPHIEIDDGIGIVSSEQTFHIRTIISNASPNAVDSVYVRLDSNNPSYPTQTVMIDSIPAKKERTYDFPFTATTNRATIQFSAKIISAKSKLTGGDAKIARAYDSLAVVREQIKASLSVNFNEADSVMTAGQISYLRYIIENIGTAGIDNSGEITVVIPTGYAIRRGAQTILNSIMLGFVANQWDTLFVVPPSFPNDQNRTGTFLIEISTAPNDLNTNADAEVKEPFIQKKVRTVTTNLTVNTAISSPAGAADNVVSTSQYFTVQSQVTATDDIENLQGTITLPTGYRRVSGENPQNVSNGMVTWQVQAPAEAHTEQRSIGVNVSGNSDGVPYSNDSQLLMITERAAVLRLEYVRFVSPPNTDSTLTANQNYTMSALVKNDGDAGVVGTNGRIIIDYGLTGINSSDGLNTKPFTANQPVQWEVFAPFYQTVSSPIIVTIDNVPNDENTGSAAQISLAQRSINVKTEREGLINIDSVKIIFPTGAIDGTLSTNQVFKVRAWLKMSNCKTEPQPTARINLPDGFDTDTDTRNVEGTASQGTVTWTITAPTDTMTSGAISVYAQAYDANSSALRTDTSSPFNVNVVKQAEIELVSEIVGYGDAREIVVSTDQTFIVHATLENFGDAHINDYYSARLSVPPGLGYVVQGNLNQRVLATDVVTWTLTSPIGTRDPKNFTIELVEKPHDENTNDEVSRVIDDDITLTIATEEKSVSIAIMPRQITNAVALGDSGVPVLGLELECSGIETSSIVLFSGVRFNLRSKSGGLIRNPNKAISRIAVVNHDDPQEVYGEVNSFETDVPIQINFTTRTDTLFPRVPNLVNILVDIPANASISDFQVTIDSTSFLNMLDVGSNRTPAFKINGQEVEDVLNVTSEYSVLLSKSFDKAFGNYPNPFGASDRPTTTIRYYLERDTNVELSIYTLLGELVWTISYTSADPQGKQGLHDGATAIEWDGRNMKGYTVLNGVYIARLSASYGKSAITKIALVK
ncbi:hypothetical protein JW960_04840 [candidate division KSB1 bacterium]|nr:hypothetical protein [candidate division KSB1 bacterium]